MINDILTIIYFNFIPVSMIVIASWAFVELVKYEHRRKNN
jgi:hypothetical protein